VSEDLSAAIERLAAIVAAENAALRALDLPAAAGLLARKQSAATAMAAASPGARPTPALHAAAGRLRDLADENRRLLECAIAVQGRVLGIVAAAARAADPAPRYGRSGGYAAQPASARALSSRA
jgi:hypothetical protein